MLTLLSVREQARSMRGRKQQRRRSEYPSCRRNNTAAQWAQCSSQWA
nr:MAG TPA: hypothetical protein [Caudoviricetes sp.]